MPKVTQRAPGGPCALTAVTDALPAQVPGGVPRLHTGPGVPSSTRETITPEGAAGPEQPQVCTVTFLSFGGLPSQMHLILLLFPLEHL